MKLCRKGKTVTGTFLKLFFIFLLVLPAGAEAEKSPDKSVIKNAVADYTHYERNSALLKSLIKTDLPSVSVLKNNSASKDSHILSTLNKLNKAAEALKSKKAPKRLPLVLKKPLKDGIPLNDKYNLLKLNYLFRMKKYKEFLKMYDKISSRSIRIKYLYALVRIGDKKKSFSVFKELFKTRSIKSFSPWVTGRRMKSYLASLTYDYWFRKFRYLIGRGRYYEFRRESRYSRSPQLTNLFTAEYNYNRKRYTKARYYLRRVKAKKLLPYKERLLIKIDLRQQKPTNFLKRIEMLSDHKDIYSQLLYDAGSINLINDKLKEATLAYNRFMVKVPRSNSLYAKIVWLNAWVQIRLGNTPAAIVLFNKCAGVPGSSYTKAAAYWSKHLAKKKKKAIESPFNYYYILENPKPQPAVMKKHEEPFKTLLNGSIKSQTRKRLNVVKHLVASGEPKIALKLLNDKIRKKDIPETDRAVMVLAKSVIFSKQKNYFDAYVSFRKGIDTYQDFVLPNWLKEITMPDEYVSTVKKYSKQYGVDPLLVLALIRQESLFNPRTRSHANAYGLMQLLPGTARQMAGRRKRLKRYHLYRPDINIRYGIKYLNFLLKKYDNQIHLALAAYNAGDHRVDKWLPEIGKYEKEMMIELIPFSETRNYVKNILRNHFYYKHYYPELTGTEKK